MCLIPSLTGLQLICPDLVPVSPFVGLSWLFIIIYVGVTLLGRHNMPEVSFLALLDGNNMVPFLTSATI